MEFAANRATPEMSDPARWAMAIVRPAAVGIRVNVLQRVKQPWVTRALRSLLFIGLGWTGAAAICLLGNAGLDLVVGPSFHWREYEIAEHAATAKVALCWLGRALLVPGQQRELQQTRALLAEIEEERSSAISHARRDEAPEAESRRELPTAP